MRYTKKHPKYTYTKRNVYYFSKVIPSDIRHHYSTPRITQNLKTKSTQKAASAAKILSARLDEFWLGLRLKQIDIPAVHLLVGNPSENIHSKLPTVDDALATYLDIKGRGKSALFFSHTNRSIQYLKDCLGSRSLNQYSSADAAKLRDWFTRRGLSTASIISTLIGTRP